MPLVGRNAITEHDNRVGHFYPPQHPVAALNEDPSLRERLVRGRIDNLSAEGPIDSRNLWTGNQQRKYQKQNPAHLHPYCDAKLPGSVLRLPARLKYLIT